MLNHITIMGRLTRDPELRYTQNQTPVCSFTVAVDRDYSGGNGQQRETDFIDCVAWRGTGEFVSKYFQKGRMIVVSGRLQSRKWQDREGNNRTSWEINADSCYFGDSKKESEAGNNAPSTGGGYYAQQGQYGDGQQTQQRGAAPPPNAYAQQDFTELDDDGDLPF